MVPEELVQKEQTLERYQILLLVQVVQQVPQALPQQMIQFMTLLQMKQLVYQYQQLMEEVHQKMELKQLLLQLQIMNLLQL